MEKKREKTLLSHKLCAFICLISGPQNLILMSQNQIRGKYQKTMLFQRELYYQQLSIACYQVEFYANNYFE